MYTQTNNYSTICDRIKEGPPVHTRFIKPYEARLYTSAEQIRQDGRVIMTGKQYVQVLLGELGNPADMELMRDSYVTLPIIALPDPDEKSLALRLVSNHQLIDELTWKTKLDEGMIPVSQELYDGALGLDCFEIDHDSAVKLTKDEYDLPDLRKKIFTHIVGGEEQLVEKWRRAIIDYTKIGDPDIMPFIPYPYSKYKFHHEGMDISSILKGGRYVGVSNLAIRSPAKTIFPIDFEYSQFFGLVPNVLDFE
ncbi:hypothetical protein HQ545_00910 [Candidatus Woesearchaeota archaeon]|nr:hypothetical protein [Candidatus Woesearchaeota archaeon]